MNIFVFGLRRSGNHFFICWLLQGLTGSRIDEFEHFEEETTSTHGVRHDSGLFHPGKGLYFYNNCWPDFSLIEEIHSDHVNVFSFEDIDLSEVPKLRNVSRNILILRCPLNLAASHYRRSGRVPDGYEVLLQIYQREYLNETDYIPDKVCVNYNMLHSDRAYARDIANELDMEDPGRLHCIPRFGTGSSFAKFDYRQLGDPNSRYQAYLHGDAFRNIVAGIGARPENVARPFRIFGYDLLERMNMNQDIKKASSRPAGGTGGFELGQRLSASALALSPDVIDPNIDLAGGEIPEQSTAKAEVFHRKYRSHAVERMESLYSMYSDLGSPDKLIVMLCCGRYFPLFRNWLLSCDSNRIYPRGNLILFCLDHESAAGAAALGVKTCFLDPNSYTPAGKAAHFGDGSFRTTMLYKNAIIVDALQLGASVLFQDTDLIWLKDPFHHFDATGSRSDIQIMYDGPNSRYKPIHGNSGFIHIRCSLESRALFETALRNSASVLLKGHQFPLGRIMDRLAGHGLLNVEVLPEHLFLNGHLFNLKKGILPRAGNWKHDGIVVHYSWTSSVEDKFKKLSKFGLNYMDLGHTPAHDASTTSTAHNVDGETVVTVHLAGQDPVELICENQYTPILRELLRALYVSETGGARNTLVHLQIREDDETHDLFLRSSQINRIDVQPPLSPGTLHDLFRTRPGGLRRLLGAAKRRIGRYAGRRAGG